ncbi:dephospho-CoA kinase, partial [uncultured Limnohabitans sp.]|uniref:dephospho-CoA kinase n=1 Tax=uncultured Limnohabitans sp. TaxID=768543 RepID=UPI002610E1DD
MTHHTWRIGLTGGIGSGKSTVANFLARRGAAIVDADAISRSLTAPGGRAMAAIARTFGDEMVGTDGAMDRAAMRERIFSDPQAKRQLEHIIHPLVGQITAEQAQAAVQSGQRVVVFDVPLLVESGERWRQQVDRVVVVDCDVETQKQRVMARSGLSAEEVERIVAQQASRAQRL